MLTFRPSGVVGFPVGFICSGWGVVFFFGGGVGGVCFFFFFGGGGGGMRDLSSLLCGFPLLCLDLWT